MKIKSIFCSVVALVLMVCFIPLSTGCDSGKRYNEFTIQYSDFVKENPDMFDENGAVKIAYDENVEIVINNNAEPTVDEKLKKFTRLSRISTSNQAVYETIFKACMLYVGSYINRGVDFSISDKDSNALIEKLNDLNDAIKYFRQQKAIVDEHSDSFYTTSHTEYNNLEPLLNALYTVVIKSSDFANAFADIYEEKASKSGSKATFSEVERFYLRSMVRMAKIYTKIFLPLIHNSTPVKSLKNPNTEELYTEYAFSDLVNKILRVYTINQSKIHGLAVRSGEYSGAELAALSYYTYILEYETIVKKAQKVMVSIVDDWEPVFNKKVKIDFTNTNPFNSERLTLKEQSYIDLMDKCYTECLLLGDMLVTLADSV